MPVPDSGISRANWWTPPATSSPFRGAASSATPRTARHLGEPCRTGWLSPVGNEVAMTPWDVYVLRKQLYISDEHERAPKTRARELRVSEAELVRRMLDGLLLDREGEGLLGQALRRPWMVSWRRLTVWRSPTASREGMCSPGTSSTRTAYEASLGDSHSLHQYL